MNNENEKRKKEIAKEFAKLGTIEAVPIFMIFLGLDTKFREGGEPIFEFLNNESIVNGMLAVSIPVVIWCFIRTIKLALESLNLEKNTDL